MDSAGQRRITSGADKVTSAVAVMAATYLHGRAVYEGTFAKIIAVMRRREGNGSPPEVSAATIARALTTARPAPST